MAWDELDIRDGLDVLRDAVRSHVCREVGFSPGGMTPIFNNPRFVITEDNLLWLADLPLPVAAVDGEFEAEVDSDDDSDTAMEETESPNLDEKPDEAPAVPKLRSPSPGKFTDRAIKNARDVVAAQLMVSVGPKSLATLARELHYEMDFLTEVLNEKRFVESDGMFTLA